MTGLYIAAWLLCLTGVLLQGKYVFCIGPRMLPDTYDRKKADLVEMALLVLVFLLLTANRTGLDILNYVQAYLYEQDTFTVKDKLYGSLSMAAYQAGWSFYMFRAVLTFLSGFLAVSTIKKTGTDFRFVLLFYLPSMLFVDSMQFRNAVCLGLFLWSFRYLLSGERHAAVRYVICILIIAQLHAVYYFTLVLTVFFWKNRRRQITGLLFFLSLILASATAWNGNRIPFFIQIAEAMTKTDLRAVAYSTSGNLGWTIPAAIHVLTTLLALMVYRHADRNVSAVTGRQMEYLKLMLVYDMLLFLTVPAIMMNLHFYRLIRGAFMINVTGVSFFMRHRGRQGRFSLCSAAALAVLAGMWYLLDLVIFENSATMAAPVLHGSLFFL